LIVHSSERHTGQYEIINSKQTHKMYRAVTYFIPVKTIRNSEERKSGGQVRAN